MSTSEVNGVLLWVGLTYLVYHLAKEKKKKHWFRWTFVAGWFPLPTLIVFILIEAINNKRQKHLKQQEKLAAKAAVGGEIPGGQPRS